MNVFFDAAAPEGADSRAATLRRAAVRLTVVTLTAAIATGGALLISPRPAFAQQCVGRTDREAMDFSDVEYSIMIDSCKAQELVDAYGSVKDASGLAGALGAKWWPVGVGSGVIFAWAWNNQVQVKNAATAGRGVKFKQVNGIIIGAAPQ